MIGSILSAMLCAAASQAAPPPASAPPSPPPTTTVEVTGEAAIQNGDVPAAKEQAREAALRTAVEQVAGTLVTSSTLVDGNILVSDRVFSHSDGYVKHYQLEGEPVVEGNSVTVKLKAEVGTAELDKDLEAVRAILERKGRPRMVLLIAEQNVGMAEPFAWWAKGQKEAKGGLVSSDLGTFENSFLESLKGKGWVFVDHDALEGKLQTQHAMTTDLSNSQIVEFAKLSHAEVAIVGRVVAQSAEAQELSPGMYSGTASYSLRAINCDNGEILDTVSDTASGITTLRISPSLAGEEALRLAAAKAAARLQQKILEGWQGDLNGSARITMKVSGIPSYRALQDFEGALGVSVRGVRDVQERSAEGSEAELDLSVIGTSKMLARQLDGKSIKGKMVSVKHVSPNELDVQVGK